MEEDKTIIVHITIILHLMVEQILTQEALHMDTEVMLEELEMLDTDTGTAVVALDLELHNQEVDMAEELGQLQDMLEELELLDKVEMDRRFVVLHQDVAAAGGYYGGGRRRKWMWRLLWWRRK